VTTPAAPTTAAPSAPRRTGMWIRLGALALVPPGVWALARWDVLPHLPLCMFQNATGLPCPGCGMTRAILRLSQGDLVGSLRMHPLGVVLATIVLASLGGTVVGLARGGDPVSEFLERRGTWFVGLLVAAFLVIWVVRCFVVPGWAPESVR
jgi:hypothetical protein